MRKKWRVIRGAIPDPSTGRLIAFGGTFEATDEEVARFRNRIERVPEEEVVQEEEEEESKEENRRRKRGRPPKNIRAFEEAPEDRAV